MRRLLVLAAAIVPFLLLIPGSFRTFFFEHRGFAALPAVPVAIGIFWLRYKDGAAEDRGTQNFGPTRALLRDVLTHDKHAGHAATALIAIYAAIIAFAGGERSPVNPPAIKAPVSNKPSAKPFPARAVPPRAGEPTNVASPQAGEPATPPVSARKAPAPAKQPVEQKR